MNKRKEADRIVLKHVMWSIGGGLVPVPWLDVVAVTAVQLDMLKGLASIYEVDYSAARGKAFASALTGSSLARVGASAVKRVPVVGTVVGGVSMSILSGASTYALGKMAEEAFESGDGLSEEAAESAKSTYQDWLERGKQFASDLVSTARGRGSDVFQSLEKLKDLQEKGVITEEEFQAQKEKLLDRIE